MQVMVAGSLLGQRVQGVATAVVGQSGAVFGLDFRPSRCAQSIFSDLYRKGLARKCRSGFRRRRDRPHTAQGMETSNRRRPERGRRSAARLANHGCSQGIVTIAGPHNELIQLGLIFFVSTLPGAQGMAGPYLQPVPAFSFFVNYFTRVNLQQGTNLNNVPGRVLEVKDVPAPMQNGRGAYLLQEVSSNGKPTKFLRWCTRPQIL